MGVPVVPLSPSPDAPIGVHRDDNRFLSHEIIALGTEVRRLKSQRADPRFIAEAMERLQDAKNNPSERAMSGSPVCNPESEENANTKA